KPPFCGYDSVLVDVISIVLSSISTCTEPNSSFTCLILQKSKDLTKCKTVYYDCMDEFCANKDSSLRRCACSNKVHDFDKAKKKLEQFEDKMLDFNKQLLTVSMDKEDAAVINIATEGELAASTKDTSESQKILNKITDALNSNGKNKFNTNLSSISLSLNEDTVWDNIDLNSGVSTTTKEGVDLYKSVLPMCEEMTLEICSQDDLEIIKSNYLLSIEQDCNTVAKSYESKYNQAKDKVYESSSLLDMSRLTVYQDKNSDDILTCRKKMLEQLSDVNVCGKDLYKCLDISGNYINPATGEAVLTENLYNLTNLIKEPSANETWQNINKGSQFIRFLTSKKTFLESAMSNCEDVKDIVWDDFINDALAKIKLAQNSKLDEIRQSCTTLLSECSAKSMTDLTEFDPRAISTFAVSATLTTQAMCSNISNSCSALMNYLDTNSSTSIATADWVKGIQGIQTNITLDSIYQNCLLVGQACVVDNCSGIAGDFTQCTRTAENSTEQRDVILTKLNCWQEVKDCVAQAETMITEYIVPTISFDDTNAYATSTDYALGLEFYEQKYNDEKIDNEHRACENYCKKDNITTDCAECLIAESIWGNCNTNNQIISPKNTTKQTILSWFGKNTDTSCEATTTTTIHYQCYYEDTTTMKTQDIFTTQINNFNYNNFIEETCFKTSTSQTNLQNLKSIGASTTYCIYAQVSQTSDIQACQKDAGTGSGDVYAYLFINCPAGYWYNQTKDPSEHNPDSNGDYLCYQCMPGTYQNKLGQTSCNQCEAGTYQDSPGQTSCTPCKARTYQDSPGQTFCKPCPQNSVCENKGQRDFDCEKGYHKESDKCAPNTYTIKFNRNGSDCAEWPEDMTCRNYDVCQLPSSYMEMEITRTDYTFVGWNTEPDGTGRSFIVKSAAIPVNIYETDKDNNEEIILYAQWCHNCDTDGSAACELFTATGYCVYTTYCESGYEEPIQHEREYNPRCTKRP
ncbi:MAG: InlB B-repeat-containing protein, partial [Alphaproteobacteria bacterium]|nr:InlB B-repeat-containing protein [Alphaproteobacteria bacterium]